MGERTKTTEALDLTRERPFVHCSNDELVSGVIDRLVLARNGNGRVVAAEISDFKTDRVDSDDEEALRNRIDVYCPKLNAYRSGVSAMYDLDKTRVTARLVFLVLGVVREV